MISFEKLASTVGRRQIQQHGRSLADARWRPTRMGRSLAAKEPSSHAAWEHPPCTDTFWPRRWRPPTVQKIRVRTELDGETSSGAAPEDAMTVYWPPVHAENQHYVDSPRSFVFSSARLVDAPCQ